MCCKVQYRYPSAVMTIEIDQRFHLHTPYSILLYSSDSRHVRKCNENINFKLNDTYSRTKTPKRNSNRSFGIMSPRIQNSKFKIQNSKFKIQNSKFKIQNSKFKIQNLINNEKVGLINQFQLHRDFVQYYSIW
jgi:hypothetical protein